MKLPIALVLLTTFYELRGVDGRAAVSAPPVEGLTTVTPVSDDGTSTESVFAEGVTKAVTETVTEAVTEAVTEGVAEGEISPISWDLILNVILPYFSEILTTYQQTRSVERITEYVYARTILQRSDVLSKYSGENERTDEPHGRSVRATEQEEDPLQRLMPILGYFAEKLFASPNSTEIRSFADVPSYLAKWFYSLPPYFVHGLNDSMANALETGTNAAWNVLFSRILPLLDSCLVRLADAGLLPFDIANGVREMHSIFQVLQALGYTR